ncbi:DUF5011 domain-containing protein [Neobacillus niacini]|uniref:DUF5011 domain-containing protein n=1 Tax=Neobacillus niacini TaxID=86668 RepID=UPI0021CAF405|nr:DUF5011 domain-containing protein [Neobacillus niacini]MCM3763808.1 DUF5011 domain-containing protein [Neobacillus niacini]
MKGKQRRKFISMISVLVLLGVLSGCTAVFRGELTSEEKFYLQNEDGTTSRTDVSNEDNIRTEVDESVTVGGFIESSQNGQSLFWVPRYRVGTDRPFEHYFDMDTEVGRPTKIPAGASVGNLLINPMNPNQVVVSINVMDQQQKNVDGYTHVFVSEASPKNNVIFYDFDHVFWGIPFGPLAEMPDPNADQPGWNHSDSTSTIFGNYQVDHSFFEKFANIYETHQTSTTAINTLLDSDNPNGLAANTDSPKDGVAAVLAFINPDVWNKGSFALDLKTGTTPFGTVNVNLPKLTAAQTGDGIVGLSWPAVFGDVMGYRIFQDDQPIAEVTKNETTYDVKGLAVGQTYEFTVKGIIRSDGGPVDSVLALSTSQVVKDVVAPAITMKGDNPLTIPLGGTFTDPGVTANDNVDGDLTDKVTVAGQVDVNKPGDYQLVYRVSDKAGNQAEATRTVKVVDQTGPVITLLGDNPLSIQQGSTFTDPGVTAKDNVDGDLTDKVTVTGQVDANKPGDYHLVYRVTDSAGNKAEVTRIVQVKAKEAAASPQKENAGGSQQDDAKGPLPDTATNLYNWLLVGSLFILAGAFMYFKRVRRTQ